MANVLAELFQNTAAAIREKTGEAGTMKPAEFPEKIRAIQTGGAEAELHSLIVTENGIYYPKENVEVGKTYTFRNDYTQEELQALYESSLVKTEDGDTGYTGLLFHAEVDGLELIVALHTDGTNYILQALVDTSGFYMYAPSMTDPDSGESISEGWYFMSFTGGGALTPVEQAPSINLAGDSSALLVNDVSELNPLFVLNEFDGFSVVGVNVTPTLEEISITENGTYTPSEADGFSRVTVNVEGAGTGEGPQLYTPSIARSGETISITNPGANGSFVKKYKIYDNGILLTEQSSKSYSLSNLTFGTHLFEVASAGEKFKDSEKSNAINASKYSITLNLTNVNTTFSKTYALYGDSLTIYFTLPSVYYAMPDTVTATMGGSTNGIVYNQEGKNITIESVTGDIEIAITSKEVKLLNDLSWDTIAAYAADGTLEEQFKIGDTKNVTIYTTATTTYSIPFAIAAFHHDDLADGSGKANVTFIATKGFQLGAKVSVQQWKSWGSLSEREHFISGGIVYDNLPQTLKDSLKPVTKKQTHSAYEGNLQVTTTTDRLFWLSLTEVGLTSERSLEIEGTPYPIFTDNASRKRLRVNTYSTYDEYPLRDRQDDNIGGISFAGVGTDGALCEWRSALGSWPASYFINIIGFCL